MNNIKLENTDKFEKEGFSGKFFVPSSSKKGFNALLVSIQGKHPRKKMVDTTRVYFVIKGSGTFTINETKYEITEPYQLFIIEPGQEYEYEGKMELFEFNISPDNQFRDIKL